MTIKIETRIEGKRGCGYRKPGGLYLIGPPTGQDCCKLPFSLTVCPCCGAGIRPARSWTWVDCEKLFIDKNKLSTTCDRMIQDAIKNIPWSIAEEQGFKHCPLANPKAMGKAGLVWIGEKFYPTPENFLQEAREIGISRRIGVVPKDFKLCETWVLLAHRKGIHRVEIDETGNDILVFTPAIFSVFKPTAVEYVVKGDESEEDLERIVKRGLTPIIVKNRVPYE